MILRNRLKERRAALNVNQQEMGAYAVYQGRQSV